MLRRNPTRIDPYAEENEMREALSQAAEARKIEMGLAKNSDGSSSATPVKLTAAERIGYTKKQ